MTARNDGRVGAAVVGLGVGEQHARTYAADPRVRLRAILDLDFSRAEALAQHLGGVRVARELGELVRDPEIQLVSIASFDDAHAAQCIPLLRAGKHVFVEKPLARSLVELEQVEQAWHAGGRPHLGSNLVLRQAPLYRWLKGEIAAGHLGRVYAFDGEYLYGRLHKITEGWRKDVDGYSVVQGGAVHLIDLMLGLTGQRPTSVSSVGNRMCTENTAFRYDDFVAARYLFPSGLVGRITANFGCVHPHQHVVRVFGTHGTFLLDDTGPRVYRSRDPDRPPERIEHPAEPTSKGALLDDFVAAILEHRDSEPGARRELDLVRLCLAADASLVAQAPVTIENA